VHRELCAKACVVIGTAAQNNEFCQQACQPILSQLINLCKSSNDSVVKVKSLYAVSCELSMTQYDVIVYYNTGIIREYPPAMEDFIHHKGIELLTHCLLSDHDKLVIKALFLLTSISNSISEHIDSEYGILLVPHGIVN